MSAYSSYQLFTAIRNADAALVTNIAKTNPELLNTPDERGFTPLVLATYLGHLPTVKALVEGGVDVNANSGNGTALMGVAFKGHASIVDFLVDAGADVTAKNAQGQTAADFARMGGHADLAAKLDKAQ